MSDLLWFASEVGPGSAYGGVMETIIDRVVSAAGRHEGGGGGAESGSFTAVLEITPILDGMGASIGYTATAPDGTELHTEHTVLAFDMWSGEATLYVLCAELTGVAFVAAVVGSSQEGGVWKTLDYDAKGS